MKMRRILLPPVFCLAMSVFMTGAAAADSGGIRLMERDEFEKTENIKGLALDAGEELVYFPEEDLKAGTENIREEVHEIASVFNRVPDTVSFRATGGEIYEYENIGLGWVMDEDETVHRIIKAAGEGKNKTDACWTNGTEYKSRSDIGGNYIEIDISDQVVYLYKNYAPVFKTDCVTGCVKNGMGTGEGLFKITGMARDVTLRGTNPDGTEYANDVSFWMPFNGGEGLHDAMWRSEFGGNEYVEGGSHGCVNLPPENAAKIYKNVRTGFPVIVHE